MFGSPLQRKILWRKIKGTIIKIGIPIAVIGLLICLGAYLLKEKGIQIPKPPDKQKIASPSTSFKQIQEAVMTGDYDTALQKLTQGLKANPNDIPLKELYAQLMDELKIDFKFHYLPERKRFATAKQLSGEITLTSKDPYYLTVHTSDWCYLYIFQLNSSQDINQLFPSKDVPTPNPIPPGPLRIPDGADWLSLDDVPGVEIIYLVASRWKNEELEELSARLNAERNTGLRHQLIEEILSRLRLEGQATDRLPGLVFARYEFTQKGVDNRQ